MNWDKWLCRSTKGKTLVTAPKNKNEAIFGLGSTAISYLREVHREITTGRKKEYTNKYIDKGKEQEPEGLKLLSLVKGVHIKKNIIRANNEFLTGEADTSVFFIDDNKRGFDIKCSWDLFTHPYEGEKLDPDYEWQNKVYCELYGADSWSTVYVLVNTPLRFLIAEKNNVWRKLGEPDESHAMWATCLEKWIEIEKNMIFDIKQFKKDNPYYDLEIKDWQYDIPEEKRIMEFTTQRNDNDIALLIEKVKSAREFLKTL